MKDSFGTYDGRVPEPPYTCPSCADKDARIKELEYQNKQLTEYVEKGVAFRDGLQAKVFGLEQAIKKIYTTQMYEDRKKESGVSVEMVSAILEAAEKAGCRK